jgi:hypothetical protein
MGTAEDSNTANKAFIILMLQMIAWSFILSPYYESYGTGSDAMGNGLARGLGLLLVGVPCMIFVFFTTFYFFKKNLPIWFRYISALNYVGLLLIFIDIDW